MEKITKIIQWFSELTSRIKLSNKLNLTDINIYCENDLIQILNNIYKWQLYNANKQNKNAKAIDLLDDNNRIAIQITSDTSTKKIKDSLTKFKETPFSNYDFYMFYLTDDLPNSTKKAIQNNKTKSICFLDLIQELHFNPLRAEEFIKKITEKTIIEKFKEYLQYPNKWNFDENSNMYYNSINPNFRLKLSDYNEKLQNYAWLSEIKAISKGYTNAKLYLSCVRLFHNDIDLGIKTFRVTFYEEGLSITIPNNLYFNCKKGLYLDGYIINDADSTNMDIDSLLTYFFNFKNESMTYKEFVNQKKILTYKKPSSEFIPLIFFKTYDEFKNFEEFLNKHIDEFNYELLKENQYYSLDFVIQNKEAHRNCCFHYWVYDLYWDKFKPHEKTP
ncbi:hypothetical protein BA184_09170 [Helicobacter pullorum]|uniref:SMEK domain-containing protein n=1 Tax=Helicobacter pullorum TaxID=35818 RepID=UPI0008168AC5|nr:SMEK domain-containing protein [Helicobacter pullorum]OCR03652.1 hypothetical protein BA185_09225 [Helicobacter pullorum]OCR04384.1 hypothetical protein BA729_02760 [Helicobacter pullorum]OCR07457.1 hypothetical protein BA184_09170 [Helicobacter pullorum]OCR08757.1 hypothetical protein BA730_09220 [Helicobacter pullorum]